MLRFLSDENFSGDLVRGIRLRLPGIDLVRAQDTGLIARDDPAVLAWAADHDRILITHDRATMPDFAFDRIVSGLAMPGVIVVNDFLPPRQVIDELVLIASCSMPEDWRGRVLYLPL